MKLPTLQVLKVWFLPAIGALVLMGLLTGLWKVQQSNLDGLEEKLKGLHQDVENLPLAKDKLGLKKDLLLIEKDKVNAQNAIYGTLIQILGGAFFFVTAYLTWRNVKATEQKQVTERFSKAVEQLESDKLTVQLGGIYALERIARDSPKDHWTIMEVLTSLVQTNSPINSQENLKSASTSIQAALAVIGRRNFNQDQEDRKIDLSSTSLVRLNLRSVYLQGAILEGTDLREANLEKANLREAYIGKANLSKANLNGAWLNNANQISGRPVKKVDFSEALLIQAKLTGARLRRANFSKSELHEADLRQAHLYEADFMEAKLVRANLSEADLSQANFNGANLDGAKLSKANIHKANFSEAKGLTPSQIRTAKDWESAIYDEKFRQTLGLLPERCD